jgi:hypothetical protein
MINSISAVQAYTRNLAPTQKISASLDSTENESSLNQQPQNQQRSKNLNESFLKVLKRKVSDEQNH